MPQFTAEQLRSIARAVFAAVGAPDDIASYMGETLVECDLMGHESHGVIRIPNYVERVESGRPHRCKDALLSSSQTSCDPFLQIPV